MGRMTTLVTEGTPAVTVALVAGVAVAVGMVIMGVVTMPAALELVGATMTWAVITITLHLLDPREEETSEAGALAPVGVEADPLPSHEAKAAVVVPAAAAAVAVAAGFNDGQETNVSERSAQEVPDAGASGDRFVTSAKRRGAGPGCSPGAGRETALVCAGGTRRPHLCLRGHRLSSPCSVQSVKHPE